MMKKYLALALIAPLLVSCSSSNKKGAEYNEAWVKDTNGFDILMGQFAHNIENIWGTTKSCSPAKGLRQVHRPVSNPQPHQLR